MCGEGVQDLRLDLVWLDLLVLLGLGSPRRAAAGLITRLLGLHMLGGRTAVGRRGRRAARPLGGGRLRHHVLAEPFEVGAQLVGRHEPRVRCQISIHDLADILVDARRPIGNMDVARPRATSCRVEIVSQPPRLFTCLVHLCTSHPVASMSIRRWHILSCGPHGERCGEPGLQ